VHSFHRMRSSAQWRQGRSSVAVASRRARTDKLRQTAKGVSDDSLQMAAFSFSAGFQTDCSCLESLKAREAKTWSRAVRWLVGSMNSATLIGGMQRWRSTWRLSSCEALYSCHSGWLRKRAKRAGSTTERSMKANFCKHLFLCCCFFITVITRV